MTGEEECYYYYYSEDDDDEERLTSDDDSDVDAFDLNEKEEATPVQREEDCKTTSVGVSVVDARKWHHRKKKKKTKTMMMRGRGDLGVEKRREDVDDVDATQQVRGVNCGTIGPDWY